MGDNQKPTTEEKWQALPTAMKAFNIFLVVMIVAGLISGLTTTHPRSMDNSASPPATAVAIGSGNFTNVKAFQLCSTEIEARIYRPESINYNLLDTTFQDNGDNARFSITGTAENGSGTAVKFRAFCHFRNGKITSAVVTDG